MNVLLLTSRYPWPAYTGDRLRATVWLEALAGATVALVAPPARARTAEASLPFALHFFPAPRSFARLAKGVARTLGEGLPWQSVLSAGYAWDDAIARARLELGPFDATIVILSRLHPWLPSIEGTKILDAIDSLSRNSRERARAASPLTRWVWRGEERRTARVEREIESAYDEILFVSEDECGPRGTAISNGVTIRPLDEQPRRYDFGFWGRLGYFANADAARWLIGEIWPAIRAAKPDATLVIAGADAPAGLRADAQSAGITFFSPVDDMRALARTIRVAVLPLRYGTGESTKMLEAAEAGCAVATTRLGVRGLLRLAGHTSVAEDAPGLAREAVNLLTNARSAGQTLRALVTQHYSRETTLRRLAEVVSKRGPSALSTQHPALRATSGARR